MRVVEPTRDTQSLAYRALWGLGIISALLAVVLIVLLTSNNLRLKVADPIHTPALQQLLAGLKQNPKDEALKEQIRDLDYLARRAFFTSQQFNQMGIWLLTGSLIVAVVSFKTLASHHQLPPFPGPSGGTDDLAANARWARQSVTAVALLLTGLALSLALPWKSSLDRATPAAHSHASGPSAGGRGAAAIAKSTSPTPGAAAPVTAPLAASPGLTPADRLKNWPTFRGPTQGVAASANLPADWDVKTGKGILWKTPVALPGLNSPVLWGDRIYLSGAGKAARAVYAFDVATGKVVWETAVPTLAGSPQPADLDISSETGYAAPTLAVDGRRVFALFANGDLAAFDLQGKVAWSLSVGRPLNAYGQSSSLELHQDLVLVQFDQKKEGFVAAYDTATGVLRWKTPRKLGASWASPVLIQTSRPELILVADAFVHAYDPGTGKELWQSKALAGGEVAPSPVFSDGRLFFASDHGSLVAVDAVSHARIWEGKDDVPGIGTPLAHGGMLFAGLGDGGIVCWDAATGKRLWMKETEEGFYASPILAGNRVYLPDRTGRFYIFEASREAYKPVGQPLLGEEANTTPAVFGNSLIYRGAKNLFRIGS